MAARGLALALLLSNGDQRKNFIRALFRFRSGKKSGTGRLLAGAAMGRWRRTPVETKLCQSRSNLAYGLPMPYEWATSATGQS